MTITGLRALGGCPGSPLSQQQVYDFARDAGFSPDAARTVVAIAMRESGLNPNCIAYSVAGSTEASYGLMQINMSGSLKTPRLVQFGLSDPSQLLDPATNMRAAYLLSGGSNWSPWHIDSDTAVIAGVTQNLGYRTKYLQNLASLAASLEANYASDPASVTDLVTNEVPAVDTSTNDALTSVAIPIGVGLLLWFLLR
jgi:hypothetical protein